MRPLSVVPAEPHEVLVAMRDALGGAGPAILPAAPSAAKSTALVEAVEIPAGIPAQVPTRIALVVETSGSTATPKRVALSADALLASAAASASVLGSGQWLLALPVHYIAGINVLVRSIVAGTEPVILAPGPFDPLAFAEAATHLDGALRFTSLVPAQLAVLLETDATLPALQRFDRILVGGQSTPAHLLVRAQQLGVTLVRTYGASETSGGCIYNGRPIGNTVARVVDGQVELSGSVLADGYLGDDERTASAFATEQGRRWYRTGDAGELVDGVLSITGRLDDVIISGGLKVSLAAIEREVRALPGQGDAVVIGVGSDRWGEVPVVVTTVAVPLDELRTRLSAVLGPAAAPDRVLIVGRIPTLASGKPDRLALRRFARNP